MSNFQQAPPPPSGEASATDKAAEAANQGKQAAGEVAQTAVEQAREVKDEAARQARDLLGEAKDQLNQQAGTQHRTLVSNLRSLGSELSGMTDRSGTSGETGVATELVGQARDRVNDLAEWLDHREPGQLLDEARAYARRRPGTFLIGALVAGVVAGRLTRGVVDQHRDDSSGNGSAAARTDALPTSSPASLPTSAPAAPPVPPAQPVPPPGIPATSDYPTVGSGYSAPPPPAAPAAPVGRGFAP